MAEDETNSSAASEAISSETAGSWGVELGGKAYHNASIELQKTLAKYPWSKDLISNGELINSFQQGLAEGVRENVEFDLREKGLEGDKLRESSDKVVDSYLNFLKTLEDNGLGISSDIK